MVHCKPLVVSVLCVFFPLVASVPAAERVVANNADSGAVTYFSKPGDATNHTASSIQLAPPGDHGGST